MVDSTRSGPTRASVALALTLGVVALPVIAIAGLLVRLTSRGPAFYSQIRSGRGGHPFRIYKLRSMRLDCEALTGATWSAGKSDPRVTPVGRVLRRLHIDELPQLWNLCRGDMALVGPRPERPEILALLETELPRVRERLAVRPGLTGLAQIQLPADQTFDCFRRKLAVDLLYTRQRSVWLDLRILLGTGLYLSGLSYDAVRRLALLPELPPAVGVAVGPERLAPAPALAGV